jgi:electron transfer flavoprotein beta subunit
MRIIVPIKRVAALDDEAALTDGAVDADDLEHDLNDWDRFSVQAAIELLDGDGDGDGEVVVVTVGDEDADEELRTCLALGAHRAIRVWDDALGDGDPIAVGRALAAVVEREQPDVVLCGAQSSDAAHGATGVALAGHAGWTRVAVVTHVERDGDDLVVHRELEGGVAERLAVSLPVVLTVQTGINEPGYATLRAIKQAKERPLEVFDAAALGLDDAALERASGTRGVRLAEPVKAGNAQMLDGTAQDIASQIATIIKEKAQA